ncbi:MAG: nucleoside-diphosphate kinase [Candidatus Cloacimonetes bacterium]|nr:nucleoside-diphosphate kinase [Candidatus Cloacimonadota bacterium]MDD4224601.1 nucleoside-diphosphate kinase [Candidatus Cloacimonadota bacterium]
MTRNTLLLIKPNAFVHHHVGHIISILEEAGFRLLQLKEFQFTPESAAVFYEMHKGKEFYQRLIDFMCSAPTVGLLLEKDNAIADLRELVGEVDPAQRKPGTIRDLYAEGVTENAVHASDSEANAEREIGLIFG